MAEEVKKESMYESFMKAGKITVFESGLERPDHIQERPFFNLLQKGATTFINKGEAEDSLEVKTAQEQAESPYLDTEAHKFFENMEKRFRNVMPGVTLFIIDPDAVQGRYLMDQEADRSLGKSLYMFVEDKLQKANAGNNQTFLTQEEILKSVMDAGITDRNPFSMRAAVAPTTENMAGLGNVNLVVGDNPDAMSANVLDCVLGAEERRVKEGISRDEFRRLVLYHELGHATDHNYASAYTTPEKVVETSLDNVMARHRTECIADAHAVLQLARDFGTTKCAELWGDCRMEYLRICVDRRLEDTKYDSEFMTKLREAEKKSHTVDPNAPKSEQEFLRLENDASVQKVIKQLGSPLAYHTTDVIDATVKYAKEHLADGSLQKMTDLEVIKQAQVMSETYGLTREEMASMSIALATGEKHPKYEKMMDRLQESRDRMPIDNKELEKQYELQREFNAFSSEVQLCQGLGLPAPTPQDVLSKDLLKKLIKDQTDQQKHAMMAQYTIGTYQQQLLGKLFKTDCTREDMLDVLGKEKEALRKAGKNDAGRKDKFADVKLKVVDAVIQQAPEVQTAIVANRRVQEQVAGIKTDTQVSGDEAILHFLKHNLRSSQAMQKALVSNIERDPQTMTFQEQLKALRAEDREFGKALVSEREMQVAAFAIRSDKETWAKVSSNKELAAVINEKAKQKPSSLLASYQMTASSDDKETKVALLEETMQGNAEFVQNVLGTPAVARVVQKKEKRIFEGLKTLDAKIKAEKVKEAPEKETKKVSPLNLKNIKGAFRD
ncbi:MAG: hypothetical protein MJ247_00030 [Alphaproteobacteria bacterium]|nr:hypothetical protein [Alphaproteobacteria bacterium]